MNKAQILAETTNRRKILKGGAAIVSSMAIGVPALALAKPIKLGVLMPYSGGLELFGVQATQGIEMIVDEVNSSGGVLGRKIEIIRADTRTDPKTTVERAQQLVRRDRVDAVIGPITSASRDAVKSSIERSRKPLLYATDYEGGVCSKYIACYSALPAHYVDPLIPFLIETVGKKIYLFGADYAWPQKMNIAIQRAVKSFGGEIVGEEYTPFGVKDFATTIRKIEDSGAETIILTLPGADGVTFIKQFTAAGMKEKTRLAFLGFNENYLPGLSAVESEGIIGVSHFIQTLDRPESIDFVNRQKKKFGGDVVVSDAVVAHYGITKFFLDAMQRADTDDTNKIMAALSGSIVVANGEVTMRTDDKHVDLNMLLFEVNNRQLKMKKYIGKIVSPSQCS
jgi:branched-chain amino acid transport system substrate-binding protein/urea transport system substrate-binding protein